MNQKIMFAVEKMQKVGGSCILCSKKTHNTSVFLPQNNPLMESDRKNKNGERCQRHIIYFLCDICHKKDPDRSGVELALVNKLINTEG